MDNTLYHVLRYLTPYNRSKLCTVSKDAYSNIIAIGKDYISSLKNCTTDKVLGRTSASCYDGMYVGNRHYKYIIQDCHLFIRVCNQGIPRLYQPNTTSIQTCELLLLSMRTQYCDIEIIKMLKKENPDLCYKIINNKMFDLMRLERIDILKELPIERNSNIIAINDNMSNAIKYRSVVTVEYMLSVSDLQPIKYEQYVSGLIIHIIAGSIRSLDDDIAVLTLILDKSKSVIKQKDYNRYSSYMLLHSVGRVIPENLDRVIECIDNFMEKNLPYIRRNIISRGDYTKRYA